MSITHRHEILVSKLKLYGFTKVEEYGNPLVERWGLEGFGTLWVPTDPTMSEYAELLDRVDVQLPLLDAVVERVRAETVRLLLACSAGRLEYAKSAPDATADFLKQEAATFESAAKIVAGDIRPLYGMLPSWRWGDVNLPDPAAPTDEDCGEEMPDGPGESALDAVTFVSDPATAPWGTPWNEVDSGTCRCSRCVSERALAARVPGAPFSQTFGFVGMIVCETCGNKRCPHAAWHESACTGSNESGQPGSNY
jgi:hypothetical protein